MMNEKEHIQGRLEKLQNELLYILAKSIITIPLFLSLLWWVVVKANALVFFIVGVLVLAGLLFLLVRWWKIYCRLRKEYYSLEIQFKQQLDANKHNQESATQLIVFRRH